VCSSLAWTAPYCFRWSACRDYHCKRSTEGRRTSDCGTRGVRGACEATRGLQGLAGGGLGGGGRAQGRAGGILVEDAGREHGGLGLEGVAEDASHRLGGEGVAGSGSEQEVGSDTRRTSAGGRAEEGAVGWGEPDLGQRARGMDGAGRNGGTDDDVALQRRAVADAQG